MTVSRVEAVTLALRELIISGTIETGGRVAEVAVAQRLGVSRTPVRLALQVLEGEGLVTSAPNRGFIVRRLAINEVRGGFDVRGTLEGLACRIIAETGLQRSTELGLLECIGEGAEICAIGHFDEIIAKQWTDMNERFHTLIIDAAGNASLKVTHDLVCRHPLVGPKSLSFSPDRLQKNFFTTSESHQHHCAITDALQKGEGTRAEYLAREHIHHARENTLKYLREHAPDGEALSGGNIVARQAG